MNIYIYIYIYIYVLVRNAEPTRKGCYEVLECRAMPCKANTEGVLSSTRVPCHAMQCHVILRAMLCYMICSIYNSPCN